MKYLYLISIFFIFYLKNLSAYQEITIQKDSNLQNYQELLDRINNSISEDPSKLLSLYIENNEIIIKVIDPQYDNYKLSTLFFNLYDNFHNLMKYW